ncbi:MAG: hypothetical protein V3T79_04485 [Candidatus Scalindua sediminis]|jgi:uncharacterized protein (UPF0332 family)
MKFDDRYFSKFNFTEEQIDKNFKNALKDLNIAKKDKFLEVKFSYVYTAFIKAGIALLSFYQVKIKSMPGHHSKIIEKIAQILKDDSVLTLGNIMRSKRNLDFYAGGVEVTEKECSEFIKFTEKVFTKIKNIIYG